jgi:hypothetical protein
MLYYRLIGTKSQATVNLIFRIFILDGLVKSLLTGHCEESPILRDDEAISS